MKFLNAIFTYNRPVLLRNCVNSFLEFGPEGDLLIVDDGSSLPEQRQYLDELSSINNPRIKIWIRDRSDTNRLGGLYPNMEAVTQKAIGDGYDFLFFIQDDQQFMWQDMEFWPKVQKIFADHPATLVVRPVFDKLIFSHDLKNRLQPCRECTGILFKKSWYAAVGIVRLAHIREIDWHFEGSEGANNEKSKACGYSMHLLRHPTLAFVPTPDTWRFGKQTKISRAAREKYFLKPLSEQQISEILNIREIAYLEEYCIPWGWRAWSPYNFSDNRKKHLANLWRWFKKNRLRRWPKWQSAK